MPAVTIGGVPFAGTVFDAESVLRAPDPALMIPEPVNTVLEARDGFRNKMSYGIKYSWRYEWHTVPQATRNQLWSRFITPGPFNIIHIDSVTYAVQTEGAGDWDEKVAVTLPGGARYYDITFVMHQSN